MAERATILIPDISGFTEFSTVTLKFILHHGEIKEIRVAHFKKATGVAMIVAHRLLKNHIDSREYILVSEDCLKCFPEPEMATLEWVPAREEYDAIGAIEFAYADLTDIRKQIPDPPVREAFVISRSDDSLEVEIAAPLLQVYQHLINVDERVKWLVGAERVDRDPVSERIGMRHNCVYQGMTVENTCLHGEVDGDQALYVERAVVRELNVDSIDTYTLTTHDGGTLVRFDIDWLETPLPPEAKAQIVGGIRGNLESFKEFCEEHAKSLAGVA